MSIKELIDILQEYPRDFQVYIGNYTTHENDILNCFEAAPIRGISNGCFKNGRAVDIIALCNHPINGKAINCYD